ncbi:hypothetical protein OVA03_02485 [Asticcacaulis sp. SL142]|uniref:hypothetical protein n=1 Tax=Asticcacaulis sp. SL142 TaxID=2995155 RepID=UPI00226CA4E7|nr:hypothetical protein [Asticcacaulis sp. SL142]WAC48814.1 hypothetical protein OVA03_02485 [Asticcacaulis sp. SL142]
MKLPVITGIGVCAALSLWASTHALAQTAADARQFLASPEYRLHNNPSITYDDVLVKKARTLISQRQYKAALKIVDELDTFDGFDTARINYVPDIAILALASDNVDQYSFFRILALDAARVSTSKTVCKQDPYYHLQSESDVAFERPEDITTRICSSSLTANKIVSLTPEFEAKMAFITQTPSGPRPYIAEASLASGTAPTEAAGPQIMVMSVTALEPAPQQAQKATAEASNSPEVVALPAAPQPYSVLYTAPAPDTTPTSEANPKRKTQWVIPAKDGEAEKPYRPR